MYHTDELNQLRDKLASNHGRAIIQAINEQPGLSDLQQSSIVAVKDLAQYTSIKETGTQGATPDIGSTHLRITEPDGETEDLLLTMRPYVKNPKKAAAKGAGANQLSAANTYLAYSPDRFYLEDDEDGNELWPVTFPAVSLEDSTDKITVTFNKDGLVSTSLDQAKGNSQSSDPQLVIMDGTSIQTEDDCDPATAIIPCDDGGGGTGGGGDEGPYCTEVDGRGSAAGSSSGIQTYFTIGNVRLLDIRDSDSAAELQMFIKNDDDYDGECFHRSYKYRFDVVYRQDPRPGFGGNYYDHTIIQGADGDYYEMPDVNIAGINYNNFENLTTPFRTGVFPLFDLTNRPGPWRLVLSDDDKDYMDFSRMRQSDFADDIWTFDVADGTWSEVFTGFSTDRKVHGSSDDPLRESGVRRITKNNAVDRSGGIGFGFTATRQYSNGDFSYSFSLTEY